MQLEILQEENAPVEARREMQRIRERYGFVPNLIGLMAHAPALLKAYEGLQRLFDETSLSPVERQVVVLTTSAVNGCEYCVAAHSLGAKMEQVPPDVVDAIRAGRPIADGRLDALRTLTADIVGSGGWPSEATIEQFLANGYAPHQVLEVVLGVGMKTLSNYTNHIAHTPLDPQFSPAAWTSTARATR
ncbi:carboxymuconolactone decarboxylase family protein [Tautonia sociabilis]|uniref:Carboxymuconolactone decarboxylase family protein n=1 Tax=Tautonia sociabilis TaxID=2080755 RepID=A0A432ML02_9BACT|nr:carboxymuconolactone decarboxylase family protein [Tautonia sociabilis]RUL87950.1 carboxymuconolactone decarboxylase family protein [Tautonia sociabilis]